MKKIEEHVTKVTDKVTDASKKTQKMIKKSFHEFMTTFLQTAKRPEMKILPGNLTFFLILSIPPILTLVGILCSMFSVHLIDIIEQLSEVLPKDVQKLFLDFLNSDHSASATLIYFVVGFFIASNGAQSIIVVANTLYDMDEHTYIKRRIKSVFFMIIFILLFLFILIFLVYGNMILKQILSLEMFSNIYEVIYSLFVLLKWPIAFFIVFFLIKFIYRFSLDRHLPSKKTNYGAFFTTVGLILVTAIYSYYANNIAHYDVFYGNLSNLVVLMMWIYIISYIFTCGIAINISHYGKENNIKK